MLNEIGQNPNDYLGKMDFVWWHGVVEDINDPLKVGRCRVRIYGFHTANKALIPTESLPWASVIQPITSAAISGKGASPTGILPGTWVVGFFRDGPHAQDPIIMGTVAGYPFPDDNGNYKDKEQGFNDPSGTYPLDSYAGEQDTNRLARGESLESTILKDKTDARISKIPAALTGNWQEPSSAYGATYPYNHVYESQSGHIIEVDDTPGKERLHRYHKAGSFEEIGATGSRLTKIVGDDYEITIGSKSAMIKGNVLYTNEGKAQFKVGRDFYLEVDGDVRTLVHGNVVMHTKGSFVHKVSGSYTLASGGNMTMIAPRIDFNPEGVNSSSVDVGGLDRISKRRVEFPDPSTTGSTRVLPSLGAAANAGVVSGNATPSSTLQRQSEGTISAGAVATEQATTTTAATATTTSQPASTEITTTSASTTTFNGSAPAAVPDEVGGAEVPETAEEEGMSERTRELLSGAAMFGVAAGAAALAALSDESEARNDSASTTTNSTQVAAVALPPIPPTAPGVSDSTIVMAGGTGAAQEATGLPGLPTVSLYAVPNEAATLLQGYPGQTGIANTDPTSELPGVSPLPSVPVLAFPAEFAQPVILPDVLDGGSF